MEDSSSTIRIFCSDLRAEHANPANSHSPSRISRLHAPDAAFCFPSESFECILLSMEHAAAKTQRETPARHGMAVVGQTTLFFSHLPEFQEPHNYQVIFEVTLGGTTPDPFQIYVN